MHMVPSMGWDKSWTVGAHWRATERMGSVEARECCQIYRPRTLAPSFVDSLTTHDRTLALTKNHRFPLSVIGQHALRIVVFDAPW
jgi:hypothetical protein